MNDERPITVEAVKARRRAIRARGCGPTSACRCGHTLKAHGLIDGYCYESIGDVLICECTAFEELCPIIPSK